MTDTATNRKRGNSKPNVKKRCSTYTYYVYVTGADGGREHTARVIPVRVRTPWRGGYPVVNRTRRSDKLSE
jgi:hypothetical protein